MIRTTMFRSIGVRLLVPAAACSVLFLGACEVKNPGRVLDEDLNDERTLQALVVGMSGDLSAIVDQLAWDVATVGDELTGCGSYFETGLKRQGILNREDQNFEWGGPHRARWVAESGIERMREVLGPAFDGDPKVARAYLFAAVAHRISGENLCYAVIDGGEVTDHKAHFDSAIVRATEAIRQGQLANEDDIVTAAYGVLAQAHMNLGNWTEAVNAAGQVPTDFVWEALYSSNSGREENVLYTETHRRAEMSPYGTYAGSLVPADPRLPYIDCTVIPQPTECTSTIGADGTTPYYLQRKYTEYGTDIAQVRGTEMRLIEAEADLVAGQFAAAVTKMNAVRSFYGATPPLTAANLQEAWTHLDRERLLTNFAEGRRFADARRWDEAGDKMYLPILQYFYGLSVAPYDKSPLIEHRAWCMPISLNECQTNPNLYGVPECQGSY
jgi:hypothetical protein